MFDMEPRTESRQAFTVRGLLFFKPHNLVHTVQRATSLVLYRLFCSLLQYIKSKLFNVVTICKYYTRNIFIVVNNLRFLTTLITLLYQL